MSDNPSGQKQLFINMAAQIISFATSAGINFFLTPFILEKLGREAYGFVGLANDFTSYAQILVTALNSMASRFITISIHREEYEKANQYYSSLIFANAVIAAVLSVPAAVVVLFMDRLLDVPGAILTDVQLLWTLLFLGTLIGIVTSVFGNATYVRNRLDLSSRRAIISELMRAGMLLFAFVCLQAHVYYLGVAALVCTVYNLLTNIHFTHMLLPEVEIRRKHFRWARIRELLASGVWNSVTQVGSILSNGLDLLITNLFVGAAAMGVVSVAKALPTMILSVFGILAGVFMPQMNISYAKNDFEDMRTQLFFAIKLLGVVACIPVACMCAFGDAFFALWAPGEDARLLQGLAVVAILAYPLVLALEPLWNIFTVTNKIKQSSLFLIMNAFVSVGAVFILLQFARTDAERMYIVVGVSSVVALIRSATFLPLYGAKCLHMKPSTFYGPLIKNLFTLAVVMAAAFGLRRLMRVDSWLTLVLACAVTAAAALLVNYFVMLSSQDRRMLWDKLLRRGT